MVQSYFEPAVTLTYAVGAIVGLIGGVLGGWIFSFFGWVPVGTLGSLATSVIGAVVLRGIAALVSHRKIR